MNQNAQPARNMKNPDRTIQFLLIDLFCGAGGTTTGAEMSGICKTIVAVNHDPLAIASHEANHPDVLHIPEDILLVDTARIVAQVKKWKDIYPKARLILWASLECTNFSNAKGGLPRDADSRSLANDMPRYIDALGDLLDYFLIENVREFMSWGDLDEKGKPVSKYQGRNYVRWVKSIQRRGFAHDWRLLCAADFGGVTIRTRYFGAFYRPGRPFAWPQPTHARRPAKGTLFADELRPWRAVAEVLDFTDLGKSIFDRKRPLVDKTLRRILDGLRKFHTQPQIMACNSPGYCSPVSRPVGTITTVNSKALVVPFLMRYNGKGTGQHIDHPAGTLTTKDRYALITPWIDRSFRSGRSQSIHQPAGAVLTVPKMNLCTAFLVNPQYSNPGSAIDRPAPTVIATQRSRPLMLATATDSGSPRWQPAPGDTPTMLELKAYMKASGIADVFMRMLRIVELKRIQGFPDKYVLKGLVHERKKFIGNSVETGIVRTWLRAIGAEITNLQTA